MKFQLGSHQKFRFQTVLGYIKVYQDLFLEVNDGRTTILCTKIVLNPDEKSKIKQPKKGKTISNSDFVALQDQKRQEAREMWQRGQRGGSWR